MECDRYPLPDRVGSYGSKEQYQAAGEHLGQWVLWKDRVDLVLAGRYDEVMPLHVELSPTYLCNFACPWCSCRTAREDWSDEDVFNHPNATDSTVMAKEKLDRILSNLAQHRVGIQWVGGEPTMHPLLYPAALRANELGLKQCLFTNGSLLSARRIDTLLDAELVFIRVSLDAATRQVHELHHGYRPERGYHGRVIDNLWQLAVRRRDRKARTMLGVSIVVDECNINDLIPTFRFLREMCEDIGFGAIDYVICRPTYQFYNAQLRLYSDTRSTLAELLEEGSEARRLLDEVGIALVAPQSSFSRPDLPILNLSSEACLSSGWFGEINANGDYVLCSDRYGNPDYFIGNLGESSLDELWQGDGRGRVLESVERTSCLSKQCPRNGRGFHFNRIFHEIEHFRRQGRMAEVRTWIDDLRSVVPHIDHSFFL